MPRDIHAVAKDIITLNNDIANVDPDPKPELIYFAATGVALAKLPLDFDGAGDCVHGACEFHQRAVAHELDDTTKMGGNRRVDQLTPQGIQTRESPRLVHAHETRVADHIG